MNAVYEMDAGLVEAHLGGSVVKKRVPLPGRGKRGGGRLLVGTNWQGCWFFLFGFGKNQRSDVSAEELLALQSWAKELLSMDDRQLDHAVARGKLEEIEDEHQKPH